jgi:hypothetical protein
MQQDLAAYLPAGSYQLEVKDVDADAAAQLRWGLKVPVLLHEDTLVCYGRLDVEELRRAALSGRR